YLLIIGLILIGQAKEFRRFLSDKKAALFTLLVLGILFEASIIQVTSYVPKDGNIFFHSFAIAYIFSFSELCRNINIRKPSILGISALLILLWWSPYPWNYANAVFSKYFPNVTKVDTDEVSIRTYTIGIDKSETKKDKKW